jgi:RNA polymerase sigma-70 factor, ECF subfamily
LITHRNRERKIKETQVKTGSSQKIDTAIIEKSMAGDRAARDQLAEACLPRVWRTVYLSTSGTPDVEDLVQNAMIQAFNDLPQLREVGSFFPWLDRVTVNVVRQHFRRRYLRALIPSSDTLDLNPSTNNIAPDQRMEDSRLLERLAHHLSGLRPKNRMAVTLSLVQGYTVSEIALIVNCNVETAKKRLLRGRQNLVSRIQKDPYCRQILKETGL